MLTKRPSSAITLEVSLSENQDLKVLNPTLTFTPENWNIPQEIKLKGCESPDASLTFRAKANAQGGFKGTEQDELIVLFKQQRICSFVPKDSLATTKHEPSQSNSFSESMLIEFQSPFFMILRAFLQLFSSPLAWQRHSIKPFHLNIKTKRTARKPITLKINLCQTLSSMLIL